MSEGSYLSYEELERLLAARDGEIAELKARHDAEVTVLKTQVAELEARLAKLEHLLTRNSGNSWMPPSRDEDPGLSVGCGEIALPPPVPDEPIIGVEQLDLSIGHE